MSRTKKTLIILLMLFSVIATSIFWLFGRIVPSNAATISCRVADSDYQCLQVNDFSLSVYQSNLDDYKNTPVLILHGGPGLSSLPLKKSMEFLKDKYPVFTYDQRGSGYSEIKPDLSHYDYKKLIAEIELFRQTIIKQDKLIIIGHSFGAYLALSYAIKHNEHIEKLVLISTPIPQASLDSVVSLISNGVPSSDQQEANQWLEDILGEYFSEYFYNHKTLKSFIPGAASYATMITASNSVIESQFKLEELQLINQPVLMLYGEKELFNTDEKTQHQFHEQLPNSELIQIKNTGHWLFMEQTEQFENVLLPFLNHVK